MSWTTALQDVRDQLSDNATDKLRYRKACIGVLNGTNKRFKTFEMRRVSDFIAPVDPTGVYVNGALVPVTTDFPEMGEFEVTTAPVDGDYIEATYYVQWFKDSELEGFLKMSSNWLGLGNDWLVVPPGLIAAAKFYACKQACEKLALRWAEYLSETYKMEDAPKTDQRTPMDDFRKLANDYYKQAKDAQENYYTKQGQNLAANFSSLPGRVRDVPPRR